MIDGSDYPIVMRFTDLKKLTPEEEAEEDSDGENFVEDSQRFSGQHVPIFDNPRGIAKYNGGDLEALPRIEKSEGRT